MKKSVLSNGILLGVSLVFVSVLYFSGLAHGSSANFVVINTNDSGSGSLRQAILDANASPSSTISFDIGTGGLYQIIPTSPLPAVTSTTTIDGTTQPGYNGTPLIEISGNGAGANAIGLYITGAGSGSVIRGLDINKFSAQGIFIDTSNVTVQSNYIGLDPSGTIAEGNSGDGIGIFSGTSVAAASGNVIGGTSAGDGNVVAGNGQNGIDITAQNGGNASNNTVEGNLVGTNVSGNGRVGNGADGILVNDAGGGTIQNTIIGGTSNTNPGGSCSGACNLVSGNGANGIGLWHTGVSGSLVEGNYVGVNSTGTGGIGNTNIGLEINETANNIAGGTSPASRNVFSGNGGAGVFLTGSAATGNRVEGNYIGTNASGSGGIGNVKMGIGVGESPGDLGANSDIIGGTSGTTPGNGCNGACNLISGNGQDGIFITDPESYGHQILGNYIGLNASGTNAIGNALDGIGILNTPNILIGDGSGNGQNYIASNGGNGVIIAGSDSTGSRIDRNVIGMPGFGNTASGVAVAAGIDTAIIDNSIDSNGILGIDLGDTGSVTLNTPGGPHAGANQLQNYPDVYAANTTSSSTVIGGELNSVPNSSFQLEFFYSSGCTAGPPRNYGQGQNYIGSEQVSTDQFGNTSFGFNTNQVIPGNSYVTATATYMIGSVPAETSEFSKCIVVNASKPALTNGATWFLKDYLISGAADKTFGYGFPTYELLCAWDPSQPGVKLPVIYSGGTWYMRASYTTGTADLTFNYGSPGDIPICGDWTGNGVDTVGVVTPNMTWYLRNSNSSGPADITPFQYGPLGAKPVVGDWTGDGKDTIGVVTTSNNWYLKNSNSSGPADISFNYGFTPGYPVVGDWLGNGKTTVGSVSSTGTWALRDSNTSGAPDQEFQYGFPGATPIVW